MPLIRIRHRDGTLWDVPAKAVAYLRAAQTKKKNGTESMDTPIIRRKTPGWSYNSGAGGIGTGMGIAVKPDLNIAIGSVLINERGETMALDIRFAGDMPDGPKVATKAMGHGKIHLVDKGDTLCSVGLDGMATGRVVGEMDWGHSDLCGNCLQKRDHSKGMEE